MNILTCKSAFRQFLKGNNMEPIKIYDGGKYAQDSNAYNFCDS